MKKQYLIIPVLLIITLLVTIWRFTSRKKMQVFNKEWEEEQNDG